MARRILPDCSLGEPFSFPADFLLERMNEDRPNVPVIGGMASGGAQPVKTAWCSARLLTRKGVRASCQRPSATDDGGLARLPSDWQAICHHQG